MGKTPKQLKPRMLPLGRVCIAQGLATSSSHSNLVLYKGAVLSLEMGLLQSFRLFTGVKPDPSVYFTLLLANSPSPHKRHQCPQRKKTEFKLLAIYIALCPPGGSSP